MRILNGKLSEVQINSVRSSHGQSADKCAVYTAAAAASNCEPEGTYKARQAGNRSPRGAMIRA